MQRREFCMRAPPPGVGKADWIISDKEGFVLTVVSLQKKKIYLQQWSLPLPDYLVSNIPLDFYARIKLHAWLFLQPLLIQIPIELPVRRTTS